VTEEASNVVFETLNEAFELIFQPDVAREIKCKAFILKHIERKKI